ncbi:MAG TPA: multidrug efflux RND transporter permease subunit [Chthoniobacteraceae bacterium]|nr:multidrug efflux RND transporter permease subunit [Chthoniobacteraceae bacterium]
MNIAHFFIPRPVFAAVLAIVTVIGGALAILGLPVSQYPEIAPPTVTVTTSYPGANAKTVAETVATPIEEQVNGVENMLYMSSQATNDGAMKLTITFKVGTNLDVAQVQVQNRVAIAQPQLPPEVQQEGLTIKKASPDITLVVALYSPDNSHDTLFMSNYATLQLRDEIARLPGVGDITVFGVRDYSMRLWLDPDKMASRSITVGDVVNAVKEQNVQVAAGLIGGPPLKPGASQFQYTMNVEGRLTDPSQFSNMVINVGLDGRITQFKDIGHAELAAADYSTAMTYDGKPAVAIAVFELPGANAIQTANAIYARLKELRPRFPQGVEYTIPYDTTLFVRDSMRDVIKTLFESVALVALVVMIFLQNWRAALVPLLAIPVSLIGTFAIMFAAHFSMNLLTLFGLVLAIGIVVDDAIVVVENVERWVAHGLTPQAAAFRAMDEVTPAVIAIAFGLSAVFIPVAFISGITGQFYRQFALTISFSTLLSAFNSLTLSPALAALLLKPHDVRPDLFTRGLNKVFGWFFRGFNRAFESMSAGYVCVLRRVVRFSVIALFVYAGLVGLAYFGFKSVPTGFIPPQDQGYLIVPVQMPDAASIDRTQAVMERVGQIGLHTKGVKGVFTVAGLSILANANSSAAGVMFCPLDDFSARAGHADLSANAIANALRAKFASIQDAIILVFPPPPIRGVGNAGGFKMQIEDRSGTATPQQLQAVTQQVIAAANKRPEIAAPVFSTFRASFPQLYGNIDRVKAKQQNVAVTDIFQTLQVFLGGLYINEFNYLGRTWEVVAQADAQFRSNPQDISRFETRNSAGQMVPLGAVMNVVNTTGPDRIQRYDLYNTAEISGNAAPGYSSGQALQAMKEVATQVLPRQYSFEWTDLAYQEEIAGNTAVFIFPLCILFVWLTHSAEYESFALSTAIILIVPMCLLCGIAGVYFRHMDNNIFTQIGFVVLAGMSVKNAVLIVEFAKQQQEHHKGMRAADAAIQAAHLRLRPILMTSLTFIFGVLPLVIAEGAGAEMRQALGTAVFFGMIGVTIFGVFFTPVFYRVIRKVTGKDILPEHELAEDTRPAPAGGEGI